MNETLWMSVAPPRHDRDLGARTANALDRELISHNNKWKTDYQPRGRIILRLKDEQVMCLH